jgi:prevent-host-death family protein
MTKTWQLQEAQTHFSELVGEALKGQPQVVTQAGEEAVVILRYQDYKQLRSLPMES